MLLLLLTLIEVLEILIDVLDIPRLIEVPRPLQPFDTMLPGH